jgi:predicted HicB family RNase H-like nuclease
MNKPVTYKGYTAKIEFSEEDECLIGRVSGIRHIITFHGDSVKKVKEAFKEAVDFYLDTCAKRNETPEKPFTGRFVVRVSPELHSKIATAAKREHKSINAWIAEVCKNRAA